MSWLSNIWKGIFGDKKKEEERVMNAARPVKSLTEIPTGEALNKQILAGLSGQGIGFDPRFVERTTSPVAAEREARFRTEEVPFISGEMSGRGLGRSTIAGETLRRAAGQKERDINSLIAEAYTQNEQQKKLDEARYQQLATGFTGAEAGAKSAYSQDDLNRVALLNQQDVEQRKNINQLIGLGVNAAATVATGGAYAPIWAMMEAAKKANELSRKTYDVEAESSSPFVTTRPRKTIPTYNI